MRNYQRIGGRARLQLLAAVAASFTVADAAAETHAAPDSHNASASVAEIASQIVIAAPGTSDTAVDPENVNGIGQMIIDNGNGTVGLCTGTLINPRTVLFAAHCVNGRAASAYGAGSGGTPIAFGFSNYNLPALLQWIGAGPGQHETSAANFFYNVNHVAYHSLSLEAAAQSFLYGDVAIASLDTHAADIPTWALLFSALPAPAQITADGTGYHVALQGYGRHGSGAAGSVSGSDFRRRAAENMLGALASLQQLETFLFGSGSALPQNLYFIDFDDPLRGTGSASPYDFNVWRDNATPNEGITASGDSGGPLILDDTFAQQVVIGVLSGGYTRFFGGQGPNSYGTTSFYQPLYLYWDWIAANNVYHYVSAVAGDGDWENPNHWVTTLDPNYQIIGPDGQLVNGVPDDLGEENAGTSGGFGQACFQSGGVSECLDIATGATTVGVAPIGTAEHGAATQTLFPEAEAQAITAQALPAATFDNGLPGATNFVPDNFDGDRLAGARPRYFDVTLTAAGTTRLSSAATVDRFAMTNADARLNITSGGALHSLTTLEQWAGSMNVDGLLQVEGDYLLFTGLLSGSGTIDTPFLTSVAGAIAPGAIGTIGQLTIQGDAIFSSGTMLLVDLGPNGQSDRLVVEATADSAGEINLGGILGFAPITGYSVRAGDEFTIITAEGGITGAFNSTASISAIITALLTYEPNAVLLSFDAGLYGDLAELTSPVQTAYATLLDQNRPNQDALAGVYGPLDLQSAATIASTLDSLAPAGETTLRSISTTALETNSRFFRSRLATLDPSEMDGSIAVLSGVQLAAIASSDYNMASSMQVLSDAGGGGSVIPARLPRTMRAFIAAGHIDGDSASMIGLTGASRDSFDGWFGAAGVEGRIGANAALGIALSYSNLEGQSAFGAHRVSSELFQLTAYGNYKLQNEWLFDGQVSVGVLDNTAARDVVFLGAPLTLQANDDTFAYAIEAGLSRAFDLSPALSLIPRGSLRASQIQFSDVTESGGGPAMTYDRSAAESLQARLGATLQGRWGVVQPYISATIVHEFEDGPSDFGANFAGGIGPNARFALNGQDSDWVEIGAGLSLSGERWSAMLSIEIDEGRSDISSDFISGGARLQLSF